MHIDWSGLQTVEALVRLGGVQAAAAELGLRHTSISRRVAALEASLGVPLFTRGARLKATPMARALAQRAGELVDKAALTRLALGRELERYDRSIDVHVSRLRHKLAEASAQAPRIDAVRGAGYVLVAAAP